MDFIGNAFVWLLNTIESGRAKAISVLIIGLFLSYIIFHALPLVIQGSFFIYPDFQQHIYDNELAYRLGFVFAVMLPTFFFTYLTFNQLNFINEIENRRRF